MFFNKNKIYKCKISNSSKYISTKEIVNIIKYIPHYKKYLPKEIIITDNQVEGYCFCYNYITKKIQISLASFTDCESYQIKIAIISALFHELRHAFQHNTYNASRYQNIVKNYNLNTNDAFESSIEKDAYKFSIDLIKNKKDKINKMLSITDKWSVFYEDFKGFVIS